MKRILVLVKQVPATENVKLDEKTGTMVRSGVEAVLNPLDLHAVEEAVRLRETGSPDLQVSVLSMGPPQAAEAVREALALGAGSGFLLSGQEFAGADTWATANALAHAIRTLGPFDLVLCGERATDGETGQVGPMVGALLDWPILTYVSRVESGQDGGLIVGRAIEDGHEVLETPLPAVLCVVKEINEPRLPTLEGKKRARRTDVPILSARDVGAPSGDLGLAGSPTRVVKVFYPSVTRVGETCSTDRESVEACVERLVEFLKSLDIPRVEGEV